MPGILGVHLEGPAGHLWLQEDLPTEVPGARIFLYEYNATLVYGKDRGTFIDKASELLEAIAVKRRSANETRPIIFLCHSMGGLLVGQALINAHNNPHYTSIKDATSGLVFFATPQRGGESKLVGLGSIVSNIAKTMNWQKGSGVMEVLKDGNLFSEVLQEHRRHQFPQYDIVSFWGAFDDVVPPDSSRLSLSGDNENIVKLNADHSKVCKFGLDQDGRDNLETVQHNINEVYVKALKKHRAPQHHIPLPRNKKFTGRTGYLWDMKRKLFPSKADEDTKRCQLLAISGLGGVGKTQLALQFAFWVKDHHPDYSVFWVPLMSRESFEHECFDIGKKVGILRDTNRGEDPKEPFWNCLNSSESGKWLLVVDNADDENIVLGLSGGIYNYLRNRSDKGLTVLTTRVSHIGLDIVDMPDDCISLPSMSEMDAEKLLRASLVEQRLLRDRMATMELLQDLTHLPSAIIQAAAYLNRNQATVQDYLRLLRSKENRVSLMDRDFNDRTRYPGSVNTVLSTWYVSFKQIRENDKSAGDLLSFISCIEPKAIPRSLLPQAQIRSEEAMQHAIGTLSAYAFLARCTEEEYSEEMYDFVMQDEVDEETNDGDPDNVSMQDEEVEVPDPSPYLDTLYDTHTLVHFAMKQWIPMDEDAMAQTLKHFEKAWEARGEYLWRLYLPHTLCLLEVSDGYGDHTAKFDLCFRVGKCLSLDHRFQMAIGYFEEVFKRENVAITYASYTPNDSLLFSLGNAYLVVGRTRDAIPLLKAVVHTQLKHLGRESLGCQRCERALANAYIDARDIQEAVGMLGEIKKIHDSPPVVEPHEPHRLETEFLLGRARLKGGQTARAIELLEQAVRTYKHLKFVDEYDEYETNRLLAQHWLAVAYRAHGNVPKALSTIQPVVDEHRRVNEEEDSYRLLSEELLSELLMENRRSRSAMASGMELRKHVLAVRGDLAQRYPARPRSQSFYCLGEFKEL
ncbi:P-loop containing nucleoside triphosphate hydrolase protein [Apiospora rasikravindrae]|uniref:P-loop containing nucleoside triphosphate hydrolase protein n=1 Tax=Apiospora rasikravindrae TaxID=990691 RepID=A0ABR1SNX9_9PEZI